MTAPAVLVTQDGPVRTLTLNRPHRRNALNREDRRELLAALTRADRDPECHVVLLSGNGKAFCAGADIQAMAVQPDVVRPRMEEVNDLARALVYIRKPVIAAVAGGAFGLGLSIVAACDYVVAAEDARFIASFGRIGLTSDTGLSWTLPRRIGVAHARRMVFFAEEVGADEAHRIGLVDELDSAVSVLTCARQRAEQLAGASRAMISATKRIFAQPEQDFEALLAAETDAQVELLASVEFAQRREAFFTKSSPKWPSKP